MDQENQLIDGSLRYDWPAYISKCQGGKFGLFGINKS